MPGNYEVIEEHFASTLWLPHARIRYNFPSRGIDFHDVTDSSVAYDKVASGSMKRGACPRMELGLT